MREDGYENESTEGVQRVTIPLNGTFGAGPSADLTVITAIPDTDQVREETFKVPYVLIDTVKLQRMCDMNFLLGYKVVKDPEKSVSALKGLGL